jgi:hypothetical protein
VRWKVQQDDKIKEQKDGMTKGWKGKECNIGNKKLMNGSSYEASQTRKNFKQKEKDRHKLSILSPMVSSCSNDKGNILR